jgi:hypothetical protein
MTIRLPFLFAVLTLTAFDKWSASAALRGSVEAMVSPELALFEGNNKGRRLAYDTCEVEFESKGLDMDKFFANDVYYKLGIDFPTSPSCSKGQLEEMIATAKNLLNWIPELTTNFVYRMASKNGFMALGGENSNEVCAAVINNQIKMEVGADLRLCYIESEDVTNPATVVVDTAAEELAALETKEAELAAQQDKENFAVQQDSQQLENTQKLEDTKLEIELQKKAIALRLEEKVLVTQQAKEKAELVKSSTSPSEASKILDELEVKHTKDLEAHKRSVEQRKADFEKQREALKNRQAEAKEKMAAMRAELYKVQQESRKELEDKKNALKQKLGQGGGKQVGKPAYLGDDADYILEPVRNYLENKLIGMLVSPSRYGSCWEKGTTIKVSMTKVDSKEAAGPNCRR